MPVFVCPCWKYQGVAVPGLDSLKVSTGKARSNHQVACLEELAGVLGMAIGLVTQDFARDPISDDGESGWFPLARHLITYVNLTGRLIPSSKAIILIVNDLQPFRAIRELLLRLSLSQVSPFSHGCSSPRRGRFH
eukprot:CAMPEP_0178465858 /NCGR_PEP_ID=MMETSP0689_2-20121128/51587_1 /TAXON_ID=160604 /ORGANISM="Amphidinium massartii, Strain CS-259" /LENGTH=134 /DNA_ID=CAMNT_0020092829 /DNA_START=171 /DNA_END=575 /DNA_ORIENTATION=+